MSKQKADRNPLSRESLVEVQKSHIETFEKIGMTMPKLHGVAVVKALTYDLLQVVNDAYLREHTER